MANAFGIITAIVLALSIFVAFKNKAAYEAGIVETATQKENLRKSEERLKIAKNSFDEAVNDKKEVDGENAQLTEQSNDVRSKTEKFKTQNEEKKGKVASNKEQLDGIRDKTSKVGNIEELASKMRELGAEREQLGQSITDNEAKLANLTAENNQAETQSTALRVKLDTFASGQSLPSLNTRIRSIYPTWGFVTLASGNNAGVVANSTLEVVRDDQTIAKLLVTAVEATTSSASIVPDSIVADVTLMVGDRVVATAAPAPKTQSK